MTAALENLAARCNHLDTCVAPSCVGLIATESQSSCSQSGDDLAVSLSISCHGAVASFCVERQEGTLTQTLANSVDESQQKGPATPEQADIVSKDSVVVSVQSPIPSEGLLGAPSGLQLGLDAPRQCQTEEKGLQLPSSARPQQLENTSDSASPCGTAAVGVAAASSPCAAEQPRENDDVVSRAGLTVTARGSAGPSCPKPLGAALGGGVKAGLHDGTDAEGSAVPAESVPVTPTTPLRPSADAPLLPPPTDPTRMTLVLDLDGTLIASEDEPHAPVPFDYCVDDERFVWLRPGLRRFLDAVRPQFEVVLFTAAGESWATCALQRIDPDGTIFDSRLYRDHTVFHDDWPWVKDLSRLGRDLARVVIVDDNPLMFMYQPDNALHVAAYDPQITGHSDDVLEQVLDVLVHKLLPADDVREVLRNLKEPITASCVAARQAASKAVASSHPGWASGKAGAATGATPRKAPGAAASSRGPAPLDGGHGGGAGGCPAASRALSGPAAQVHGSGGPGRPVRRGRRSQRAQQPPPQPPLQQQQHYHQQQQQQQQQQPQQPGLPVAYPATVAATALPPSHQPRQHPNGAPHQPHGEKKHRQQRRRRGQGGSGGAERPGEAACAGGAAAQTGAGAGQLQPVLLRTGVAAVVSRQTGVVSRSWAHKQGSLHVALQQAAASALHQPEHQLQLKLKLLQLQRAQEEEDEEEDGGANDEEQLPSAAKAAAAAGAAEPPAEVEVHKAVHNGGISLGSRCLVARSPLSLASAALTACTLQVSSGGAGEHAGGHRAQTLAPATAAPAIDLPRSPAAAAAAAAGDNCALAFGTGLAAALAGAAASSSVGVVQPSAAEPASMQGRGTSRSARRRRKRREAQAGSGNATGNGASGMGGALVSVA